MSGLRRGYAVSQGVAVVELLSDLTGILGEGGFRWYLFGAQAVMIWSRPRMSADVDITVEMAPEKIAEFVQAMDRGNFVLRVNQDVEGSVARTRVLPFLHRSSDLPLDVVLAGPGLEEQFLDRVRPARIGDLEVPVISPEDLIVTKILAGRAKDLEDVHGILQTRRASLELNRIRETLRLLEEALGPSDLLPVLETELGRLQNR